MSFMRRARPNIVTDDIGANNRRKSRYKNMAASTFGYALAALHTTGDGGGGVIAGDAARSFR